MRRQIEKAREQNRAGILGSSPALLKVLAQIERVAPTVLPVLILGESGTGKERVAKYVHACSTRNAGPFVVVNCGAIPKDLAESVLFGFERGSFSGAVAAQKGKFELADGGTVLLDELGDLPLDQQVKLLRVLQEGVVERIGGTPRRVDVRVVAATNRDLQAMMEAGAFRDDLYYRVCGLEVTLPPLREREQDILTLGLEMLRAATERHGLGPLTLSAAANRVLLGYSWPGNIREFERVIETAAVLVGAGEISGTDILTRIAGRRALRDSAVPASRPEAATPLDRARALVQRLGRGHAVLARDVRAELGYGKSLTASLLRQLVADRELVRQSKGRGTAYVRPSG